MDVITRPRELPELRHWLVDMWQGPFAVHAATSVADRFIEDPRYCHLDPHEVHFLNRAELWWITPEMSRLVSHAAESLPPTTLTPDLIPPNKVVLAFFAEPLIGVDAQMEDHEMKVRCLVWYRCKVFADPNPDHIYTTVAMYADAMPYARDNGFPYVPVGRTDWRYGTDTETPTFRPRTGDSDALRLASMAQDRRWLAALALLSAEPLAETTIVRQTNKAKIRRDRRRGIKRDDIRLVGLRTAPRAETEEGGSRKVEWSHRWLVGSETGGFWKQVAYGPGHSLRRPQWILPFEKGPKNKPLVVKDTVHIVRDDR